MTWHGKDVNEHWGLLCSIPAKVRHPAVGSCWGLIIYVPAPLCSCCLILSVSVTHFPLSFKLIVFSFIFPFFIYFILHISWCFVQSFYQGGPPTAINSVTSHLMSSAIKGRCFSVWCYSHLENSTFTGVSSLSFAFSTLSVGYISIFVNQYNHRIVKCNFEFSDLHLWFMEHIYMLSFVQCQVSPLITVDLNYDRKVILTVITKEASI